MKMSVSPAAACITFALCCSTPAVAQTTVFFGEDLGAGSPAALVNSTAARDRFVAALTTAGTQSFESIAAGTTFPAGGALSFAGTAVTATAGSGFVRDVPFNARFAVDGSQYLDSSQNVRLTFSQPVSAFGTFVIDANELLNDTTVTVNGQPLTPEQIAARPFGSVSGIFRLVTERAPGEFELLFDGGTFPAPDSSGLFVGVINTLDPFDNVILVNGAAGLDNAFQDGFAYDQMIVGEARVTTPIPEPQAYALMLAGLALLALRARQRG